MNISTKTIAFFSIFCCFVFSGIMFYDNNVQDGNIFLFFGLITLGAFFWLKGEKNS